MSVKHITILRLNHTAAVLSTRERGREAADRLQDALQEDSVVISFAGVEVATPSFLDEVLTRLHAAIQTNEQTIAIVTDMNEDVRESVELVLAHRGMMLGVLEDGHIRLLGGKRHLQQTMAEAEKLGTFRATELAEALKLKLPNLHQRLKVLREAGAIGRETDETAQRGRRHDYRVLDPGELAGISG
jgi:DNA-binding transcriptional ArsR family regulator